MRNCVLFLLFLFMLKSESTLSKSNLTDRQFNGADVDDERERPNPIPDRVIGGRYARKGEFPYSVLVSYRANASSCGGVILSKLHVLTACHCTVQFGVGKVEHLLQNDNSNTRVVAGSISRNPEELNEQGYQIRWVFYSTQHPRCESLYTGAWIFDLAIIVVTQPLIFNNLVQPAKIPTNELSMKALVRMWQTIQKNCIVAGWGFTVVALVEGYEEVYSEASLYQKALATRLLPPSNCYKYVCRFRCTDELGIHHIDRICAKSGKRGAGTICGGDSGGPLVCGGFVVGLVSYSSGCSLLDDPVVYARVDVAYQYIADYYYKPLSFLKESFNA